MPSTSSGRITKSRKGKNMNPHKNRHRWESFTTKISKLHSLDPLRKVRHYDLDEEDLSATNSYLRNELERWADLNISKLFTTCKRQLAPLCESLAQILHFEDRIMGLLVQHISQQDKEALEPLLELLTAFAHDLGRKFEKHYSQALSLIIAIASRRHDAEVIEWAFKALAFLFKYLAPLLVPDLRPTYDAIAPLLGKTRQPPHIARFAAEAMSFLVKKAAAPNNRGKALLLIVGHARDELQSVVGTKQYELFSQGTMTMFAEATKSSGNALHSSAPELFGALLEAIPEDELSPDQPTTWTDVCCGVLTSAVHHSTQDTFQPIETALISRLGDELDRATESRNPWRTVAVIRILGIIAGVRKGNRVGEWTAMVKLLNRALTVFSDLLIHSRPDLDSHGSTGTFIWQHVVLNTALVWGQAPIDSLIPHIGVFLKTMTKEPLMRWYIPFCSYLADLDSSTFQSLFQKSFQQFVATHWSANSNEEVLCTLLPRMVASGAILTTTAKDAFPISQSWQDQIVSKFEKLEVTPFPERGAYDKDPEVWRDRCMPKYSALLQVLEATSVHPSTNARIAEILLQKVKLALRPSSSIETEEAAFIMSEGFRAYLRMNKGAGTFDASLQPLLRAAASRFSRSRGFLEALLTFETDYANTHPEKESGSGSESPMEKYGPLLAALFANLRSPSHDLRLLTLQVLAVLDITPDQDHTLATMLQIEETPLDLQHARNIAAHIRKLGQSFVRINKGSWLIRAIPSFLFGLMTVKLSPVWDDATEAMKEIAHTSFGEEVLAELGFEWLEVSSVRWSSPSTALADAHNGGLTDFECLNLMRKRGQAESTFAVVADPFNVLREAFDERQKAVSDHAADARSKALRILSAIPAMAEKRSRKLVPHLLSWAADQEASDEEATEHEGAIAESSWSLVDRKALIGVFAQFNNPKVLYQSQRVYDSLLGLMANGDIEIQKLALKAIVAWKQEGIKPYQENLEYLLDEARFKNELTVLFHGDNQIQPQHRPELMPALLRLLYGRSISKKGAASGRNGLRATRLAVIRQLDVDDMGSYLNIAVGSLQSLRIVDANGLRESVFVKEILPARKQVGLLNMLEAIINELGTSVEPYMDTLVNAVLYCLIFSCRQLKDLPEEAEEEETTATNTSLYRAVRTTSLRALCKLFQNAPGFGWNPYQDAIVNEVVSPRIGKLPAETTQGVSWILRLLSTWSTLPKQAMLLAVDEHIVPSVIKCLAMTKGKDEVKTFALGIVRNLIKLAVLPAEESEFNELIRSELLAANTDLVLVEIGGLLRSSPEMGRDLLQSAVDTVVELAPLVGKSKNVKKLLDISTFLLNQPSRKVNPKVKGSLLLILKQFIVLEDLQSNTELKNNLYKTVSSLFGFFKDSQNRQVLGEVLQAYASQDASVRDTVQLCVDLNAYVQGKLEQPDYNRRLGAFNRIAQDGQASLTVRQWIPVLHNLVFYIRQDEEFGVMSSNSADGLCKFIEATEVHWNEPTRDAYLEHLSDTVMPAIHAGAREPSETVRREVVRIFGFLVAHLPDWEPVKDLVPLSSGTDEDSEDAFFFHVLSPAVSRQLQALKTLEQANKRFELNSKNISQFFIPLLEHFIFDRPEGSDDHGLGAQATVVIAGLTRSLEWQQYRAVLRRFISFVDSKPELQKQVIRLLDKVVNSLEEAMSQSKTEKMEVDQSSGEAARKPRLARTLPTPEKLKEEVVNNMLPILLKYLHEKDESNVSSRVPVGIIVVKLLKLLPNDALDMQLPGVLTDISHILRSKAVESRDMARETLSKIAVILGPTRFNFILKELRGALLRGYQLHVLSYTMHSILVAAIPEFEPGSLDYCLSNIVGVIMDDVFGVTGQEKEAEEYKSKMKEVKSSKSQDSMELIARNASVDHLIDLVQPLQSLLLEKLDHRMVRKIDDLLTRISSGLLHNKAAESREALVFCYEVIQEVYKSQEPREAQKLDPKLKRYLVQKGGKKSDQAALSKSTYKLTRFALDVLRSLVKRYDTLRTPGNLAGFLPILGDAVLSGEDEVRNAAFKLLAVIVKVPFKPAESGPNDATKLFKVAVKEAIRSISVSPSTASDLAQSALKLISVLLRERPDVSINNPAIDVLLGKLKDDLTEPLYRHVTFNFLRAVLDRKVETALVYDTLDHVGTVMITNDDKDTRDLARGAFFQFLREYPQLKQRWAKQLNFVVANLQYEREGGRLSVMEAIHLLLTKSADEFIQEVASTCCLPLIMVLANDESEKCQLAAGELLKEIFRKARKENRTEFLKLLRTWVGQDDNYDVLQLAFQTFSLYFEAVGETVKDKKDLQLVIDRAEHTMSDGDIFEEIPDLIKTSLELVQALANTYPAYVLSPKCEGLWAKAHNCLSHGNPQVQLAAFRLLSTYLADFAGSAGQMSPEDTLTGAHGLEITKEDIFSLDRRVLGLLSAPEVEEQLAEEITRVVIFLGGFLGSRPSATDHEDSEGVESADEETAEGAAEDPEARRTDLRYMFWKLAYIIRKESPPKLQAYIPKLAAMEVLEVFCNKTPKEALAPSMKDILRPLRNLTDPAIPAPSSIDEHFKAKYETLKSKAQTVMDALQKKFGTAEYTKYLLAVGERIRERRVQRSSKRKIEAIARPEKAGRDKRKKFEKNKERRRVKGQEHRSLRRGY